MMKNEMVPVFILCFFSFGNRLMNKADDFFDCFRAHFLQFHFVFHSMDQFKQFNTIRPLDSSNIETIVLTLRSLLRAIAFQRIFILDSQTILLTENVAVTTISVVLYRYFDSN